MTTIAIVGAGLVGRLLAWQLAKRGQRICLFDKDSKSGQDSAAYTAAGLLTPFGESLSCSRDIVRAGQAAMPLWKQLVAELQSPVELYSQGSICVSHAQDWGDYQRFCQHISQHFPEANLTHLDSAKLQSLAPALAGRFERAAFIESEGVIDNHQLLTALAIELENLSVEWREKTNVVAIEHQTVITDRREHFDYVIDCRGVGASPVFCDSDEAREQDISMLTDLRGVRGEVLHLFAPEVDIEQPVRLMHPRYKLYLAPKSRKGHYVIGATEIESSDMSPVTVRSSLELLSAVYSLHSGFAEAQVIKQLSHCRPAFADNEPKIFIRDKLMQINGLYRHGYLLAPVVLQSALSAIETYWSPALTSNSHQNDSLLKDNCSIKPNKTIQPNRALQPKKMCPISKSFARQITHSHEGQDV